MAGTVAFDRAVGHRASQAAQGSQKGTKFKKSRETLLKT